MTGRSPAVFDLAALRRVLDPDAVLDAVREALAAEAAGAIAAPPPGHISFHGPRGDCHIKSAAWPAAGVFAVKVATGFYDNPASGLPVNDGAVLLLSAETGAVLAVFLDEGWLTSWRTAAAGALAAAAGARPGVARLGVLGAGHQAGLQALWASRRLGGVPVSVWARRPDRARALCVALSAQGVEAEPCADVAAVFAACDVVMTCTASDRPLVHAELLRPGHHVVALGADGPGKSELAPDAWARATAFAVDDRREMLAHGDLGCAVAQGVVAADAGLALGDVLSGRHALRRSCDDVTLVGLVGVGAEDVAIAHWAWRALGGGAAA